MSSAIAPTRHPIEATQGRPNCRERSSHCSTPGLRHRHGESLQTPRLWLLQRRSEQFGHVERGCARQIIDLLATTGPRRHHDAAVRAGANLLQKRLSNLPRERPGFASKAP